MGDCMDYPQTLRKFANDYSFKDREEIYTNGSMLVPLFRIEQALDDHFMDIEKAQYKMDTDSAYECGYEQGRADATKEMDLTTAYAKGRADERAKVIDEYIPWIIDTILSTADKL